MIEIWKDIPGFEAMYQASSFGRIRSLPRIGGSSITGPYRLQGRVLKMRRLNPGGARGFNSGGLKISLFFNGKSTDRTASCWIWAAFNARFPPDGMQVLHANGDINDHRPANLILGTQRDRARVHGVKNPFGDGKRVPDIYFRRSRHGTKAFVT